MSAGDTFTDTDGTLLESHTSATGTTWTKNPGHTAAGNSLIIGHSGGRVLGNSPSFAVGAYQADWTPATAEYDVEADFCFQAANSGNATAFLLLHMDGSGFGYHGGWTGSGWQIGYYDSIGNQLASGSGAGYSAGNIYRLRFGWRAGNVLTLTDVTGGGSTVLCTVTESSFPSAGHAGISLDNNYADGNGVQLDNWTAADPVTGPTAGTTATSSVTSTTLTVSQSGASGSGTLNYQFKRSTSSGGTYANVGGNSTSTSQGDTGLTAATTYWYKCTVTDSIGSTDGTPVSVTTSAGAATSYTLTAPSPASGVSGVASGNFTVTPDGTTSVTVTPSDGGAGGVFTPTSLTWSADSSAKTFTYTPRSPGAKTVGATDSGSLTDPSSVAYTSLDLVNVCFLGDSMSPSSYGTAVAARLHDGEFYLGGTSSQSSLRIEQFEGISPNIDTLYSPYVSRNVVVLLGGANNIIAIQSTGAVAANLMACCALRRSKGWKVVVCTLFAGDATSGSFTTGMYNPARNLFNAWLRLNWRSFADALCDYGSNLLLGKDGDQTNTSYFSDGLHPSAGGRAEQLYHTVNAVAAAANAGGAYPAHPVRFRRGTP